MVLILGVSSFFHGFNEGVEFSGGRSYVVKFAKPIEHDALLNSLNKAFGKFPVIKTYGSTDEWEITTDYLVKQTGSATDTLVREKLYEGLTSVSSPAGTTYQTTFHSQNQINLFSKQKK